MAVRLVSIYDDPTIAQRVGRQLRNLPTTIPARLILKFETRDFLALEWAERLSADKYFEQLSMIIVAAGRRKAQGGRDYRAKGDIQ